MAASIPGAEIFNKISACVVFFNMQNSNFRAAPESERIGLVLLVSSYPHVTLKILILAQQRGAYIGGQQAHGGD